MTIFYPDLSHYDLDRGVTVQPGTVAVLAKATHGTLFLDRGYPILQRQAAAVSAVFGGYHWLNHGDGASQAAFCFSHVGRVPVMVDAEDMPNNSGYNGPLTVPDIVDFVSGLRARGGICNLVYLPRWYWSDHMGSPDLTPLARLGLGLVSSNYTTYSDTGPGWTPYGGMAPVVWQYTDAQPYSGSHCDFNAFRGTTEEFRALINGGDMEPADVWNFDGIPAPPGIEPHPDKNPTWTPVSYLRYVLAPLPAKVDALAARLDKIEKSLDGQHPSAPTVDRPTQEQVNAAVLAAMKDPDVQAGIAAAIAAHLKVV
ncbi:MAG TPA: GH25 family lysozyme [Micromonosporaceae bacterium]